MLKRVIISTICGCFFAVGASATWATIAAGPQILQSIQGAYQAHAKANRR
jgi:hypothetical protein